jgi:hypothetical protein
MSIEAYDYGKKDGATEERERIIKLLEESVNVYLADKLLFEASIIANAIAFIKGENK